MRPPPESIVGIYRFCLRLPAGRRGDIGRDHREALLVAHLDGSSLVVGQAERAVGDRLLGLDETAALLSDVRAEPVASLGADPDRVM